jgi:hypothetical protein
MPGSSPGMTLKMEAAVEGTDYFNSFIKSAFFCVT